MKYLSFLGFVLLLGVISCDVKQQLLDRATNLLQSGQDAAKLLSSQNPPKKNEDLQVDLTLLNRLIQSLKVATQNQMIYHLEFELIQVEKRLIESIHAAHALLPDNDKLNSLVKRSDFLFGQAAQAKKKLEQHQATSTMAQTMLKEILSQEAELSALVKQMKVPEIGGEELIRLEQETEKRMKPFAEAVLGAILKCCTVPK